MGTRSAYDRTREESACKNKPVKTITAPEAWQSRRISLYVCALKYWERAYYEERPATEIQIYKKWVYRGLFAPFGWDKGWETWLRFNCWTTRN